MKDVKHKSAQICVPQCKWCMYTRYFWYPNYYNGGIKDAMWPKCCLDKMSCTSPLTCTTNNIFAKKKKKIPTRVHLVSDQELLTVTHSLPQHKKFVQLLWNIHFSAQLKELAQRMRLKIHSSHQKQQLTKQSHYKLHFLELLSIFP